MLLHVYVSTQADHDVFETNLQVIPEAAEKLVFLVTEK